MDTPSPEKISSLYTRGLLLEYFTVGYNVIEATLSILFGSMAKSIALIGFGLDSIVESLSGLILIWRLRQHGKISDEEEVRVERKAMFFVALTFFILGAYILFQSLKKLILAAQPNPSLPGILIALASLLVMPVLSFLKFRTGTRIESPALIADAKETLACSFLSVALLLGLGLNYLFGWWFADAVAGIVIVIFLFKEGWETWHEASEPDGD
jgi:cation diffusion facilitator family transporter